jgi:fatty-acid peroxygenase
MSSDLRPADLLDDVPTRTRLDRSLALLREGYAFSRRRRRWGDGPTPSDRAVELRLLGQRAVLVGGAEAVRWFYDGASFRRRDAIPRTLANTLFGKGAIHTHDGAAHSKRKAMFLDLLDARHAGEIAARTDALWAAAVERWRGSERVVLFDEAVRVIGVGICTWAGLPLTPENAPRRVWDLERIVDGFGGVGPRHLAARLARRRSEAWVAQVVGDVRSGRLAPRAGSALDVVTGFHDVDGGLLDDRTAAVELLNIVRPSVAVAWFVAFSGLALQENPRWRERLAATSGEELDRDLEAFAHEVRRLYPFAPLIGARADRDLVWHGHAVPEGRLVLLDLHGMNHDPNIWPEPETFDPGRFAGRQPDAYTFVPQGGADPHTGHRCAGERVTVELLKSAVRALTRISWSVPEQDLSFPLSRIPTRPRSGVVLSEIRTRFVESSDNLES